MHTPGQRAILLGEDDDGVINLMTPAAAGCHQARRAFSAYLTMAPVGALLSMFITFYTQKSLGQHTTGQFSYGAESTYPDSYAVWLNKLNHTAAQNYSIYQLSNSAYANPYQYEVDALKGLDTARLGVSFALSIFSSLFLMAALQKSGNPRQDKKFFMCSIALACLILLAVYGGMGGFSHLIQDKTDDLYAQGETIGLSYGKGDAQNAYCPQMNITGTCPNPMMYYNLIHDAIPRNPLTQTSENLYLFATILLSLVISPLLSATIYVAKKAGQRYGFFRESEGRQSQIDLAEHNNADYMRFGGPF